MVVLRGAREADCAADAYWSNGPEKGSRPRFPGAAQHEVMRCRPGIVTNSERETIPDQRCTACALHRIRETGLMRVVPIVGGLGLDVERH
jgi:hypothetical protein